MKRKINIPIFVSHQGCPNDCIFCNQKRITGVWEEESAERVKQKIDAFLETCRKVEAEKELAYFGGSFTGLDTEKQLSYLRLAQPYIASGAIQGIRISTRPDYIDKETCDRLFQYGVTTVELGVQSMFSEVLRKNKRSMEPEAVHHAVSLLRQYPFSLGLQMMTGMYGSDAKKDWETAGQIIALGPDFVRIYPTVVLKDTALFDLYQQGEYQPMSLSDSVALSAKLLDLFDEAKIPVIRLGLMAGEEVNEAEAIGPYHSSYRELCESCRIRKKLESELSSKNTLHTSNLHVICNPSLVSQVIGNKRANLIYFKEKYGITLSVTQDAEEKGYRIEKNP